MLLKFAKSCLCFVQAQAHSPYFASDRSDVEAKMKVEWKRSFCTFKKIGKINFQLTAFCWATTVCQMFWHIGKGVCSDTWDRWFEYRPCNISSDFVVKNLGDKTYPENLATFWVSLKNVKVKKRFGYFLSKFCKIWTTFYSNFWSYWKWTLCQLCHNHSPPVIFGELNAGGAVLVVKWPECSPSTQTIRVRITLKPTLSSVICVWK